MYPEIDISLFKQNGGLLPTTADLMVENCIGKLALP